jgi:hypothetical protein
MHFNGLPWTINILSCDGRQAVSTATCTLYAQRLELLGFSGNATRGQHHMMLLEKIAGQLTTKRCSHRDFCYSTQ